ncbi:hypothetical protein, partial [Bacteroides fragilis]|uniref:hypothetical protein n=1 Tax=Bacteroides fragilis TaxID=817 RepID=UPI001F43CF7D
HSRFPSHQQEQSNPRCLQEEEGDNHLTPFSINLKAKIRIYNFTPQSYSLIRKKSHEFASFSLIHSLLHRLTLEENT